MRIHSLKIKPAIASLVVIMILQSILPLAAFAVAVPATEISNLSVSTNPYNPAQGEVQFSYTLSGSAMRSQIITMVASQSTGQGYAWPKMTLSNGAQTLSWDGTDSVTKAKVKDGTYSFLVEVVNSDNVEITSKTISFTIKSEGPSISKISFGKTPYDPVLGSETISYTLAGSSGKNNIIAKISSRTTGQEKEIANLANQANGIHTFTWDGKDKSGVTMKDGSDYLLLISGTENAVNFANQSSLTIKSSQATKTPDTGTAAPAAASLALSGLSVSKNPYDATSGSLNINYTVAGSSGTNNITATIKSSDRSQMQIVSVSNQTNGSHVMSWSGKDSNGNVAKAGTYSLDLKLVENGKTVSSSSTFTVSASKPSTDTKTGGATSGAATGSITKTSSTTNTDNSSNTGGATSGNTEATLKASPDILTCKGRTKVLYFEGGQPAYDSMGVDCTLKQDATVNASVYTKAFDPKNAENSSSLIKNIKVGQLLKKGKFFVNWDGFDDYDQAAELGDYVFVVEARPNSNYTPDISIQKFSILEAGGTPAASDNATTTAGTALDKAGDAVTGVAGPVAGNIASQALHGAAGIANSASNLAGQAANSVAGAANNIGNAAANATNAVQSAAGELFTSNSPKTMIPRVASKCPGTYYPSDITGSPFETSIKLAYDLCLIKGFDDGTFRSEQNLTRAEAAKIIVLASGHLATSACYNSSCGSPFGDLEMWQSPWIRAAWDLKFVSGTGQGKFSPNKDISRAEAVALIAKGFGIPAHTGCWSANCGAGFPDNFFNDIKQMWQGPYLRALWDARVISTVDPGKFYPEIPVTRGQFISWAMQLTRIPVPTESSNTSAGK